MASNANAAGFRNNAEEFASYWQKYGELEDAVIVRDATGKSRGVGFIIFKETGRSSNLTLTLALTWPLP